MRKAAKLAMKRAGPGRPAMGASAMKQIAIRIPEPMLDAIDALVAGRLDAPDRAAIMRELLAEALAARGAAGVKGRK